MLRGLPALAGGDDDWRINGRSFYAQHVLPAVGLHITQRGAQRRTGVPDHGFGPWCILRDLQHGLLRMIESQRMLSARKDAICLRPKMHGTGLHGVGIGHSIPVLQAIEPMQCGLFDLLHPQIAVQRGGKRQIGLATVVYLQRHAQGTGPQLHQQLRFKLMRPDGACGFGIAQAQRDLHTTTLAARAIYQRLRGLRIALPVHHACKAMFDQGPALVELGKADRNTTANGAVAVMCCFWAEEQTLLPATDPRQYLRALQADQG